MTIRSRVLEHSQLQSGQDTLRRNFAGLPVARPTLRAQATAIWEVMLDSIALLGYEDENGFHYGLPPAGDRCWGRSAT